MLSKSNTSALGGLPSVPSVIAATGFVNGWRESAQQSLEGSVVRRDTSRRRDATYNGRR